MRLQIKPDRFNLSKMKVELLDPPKFVHGCGLRKKVLFVFECLRMRHDIDLLD